eukprot:COSAG06_NODE_4838_length_3918_cov_1.587850_1_plen_83_part_00
MGGSGRPGKVCEGEEVFEEVLCTRRGREKEERPSRNSTMESNYSEMGVFRSNISPSVFSVSLTIHELPIHVGGAAGGRQQSP